MLYAPLIIVGAAAGRCRFPGEDIDRQLVAAAERGAATEVAALLPRVRDAAVSAALDAARRAGHATVVTLLERHVDGGRADADDS